MFGISFPSTTTTAHLMFTVHSILLLDVQQPAPCLSPPPVASTTALHCTPAGLRLSMGGKAIDRHRRQPPKTEGNTQLLATHFEPC